MAESTGDSRQRLVRRREPQERKRQVRQPRREEPRGRGSRGRTSQARVLRERASQGRGSRGRTSQDRVLRERASRDSGPQSREQRRIRAQRIRRERRRRQVRRQRIIAVECMVLLSLILVLIGVNIYQSVRARRLDTVLRAAIEQCYGEFAADIRTADTGDGTEAGGEAEGEKEPEEFADWLLREYPKEIQEKLFVKAKEGELTEKGIYQATGETLHVLSDRSKGYLEDEKAAAAHQIYMRDGQSKDEAKVTVAGDLCLAEEGFVLDHYDEAKGLSASIAPEILDMTNKTDIFYLNHEYCASDRGEPLEGKYYTFRAKPKRMELLKEMGTDLVSLANNHIYDYGEEAMLDTVRYLEEDDFIYVGGGRNKEEAVRPVYFLINGMKIGFVAATNAESMRFTPAATEDSAGVLEAYDTTEYNQVIREASKQCDYLIAYMHWGPEDVTQYDEGQAAQGREFLASGADIVVGGHPHVLQGIEYVEGKPIVYSMGDFWFNGETKYTGLLNLNITFDGLAEMSFVPCLQTEYTTQYLSDENEQREMYDFLEELSPNAVIGDDGVVSEA